MGDKRKTQEVTVTCIDVRWEWSGDVRFKGLRLKARVPPPMKYFDFAAFQISTINPLHLCHLNDAGR